jgi:Holliday junction DNA helicase RuvA
MERLPGIGAAVTLATELVVREDGWSLYGFLDESERRLFQRLLTVNGVGPRIAIAFLSTLGAERGAKAIQKKDLATLSSVSGVGRKLAERLALELSDKLGELVGGQPAPLDAPARAALAALERLGYGGTEAERALRQALAGDGGDADAEALVRRALHALTTK